MKKIFSFAVFFLTIAVFHPSYAGEKGSVIQSCNLVFQIPHDGCVCFGNKASKDLNKRQREFLVAVMDKDDQKAEEIRKKLSPAEAMETMDFMNRARMECAAK